MSSRATESSLTKINRLIGVDDSYKEKASWTTVYLGKPCKQEPCSNLTEAIKDVSEMINMLDDTGRVAIYSHNGGRKRLENILRCLYDFEETNINNEK